MENTTILIVEDEAIVAADLAGKLGHLGYEIAGTAERGEEAIELACRLKPDVVLMDIRLKGEMDGIDAAEAIRAKIDLPVIYLTAHSDAATLERAKVSQPFGYILKPFEERELATNIEMAIYKHQSERIMREQREWLRVTLSSIGDAVITCDTGSKVTFLNPVAEALTGWASGEAVNHPIQEVFRLVNEQTRQPSENPASRVLREGRPKILANHTSLLTKDGREIPIEDSAAPILDAGGKVIGVVLVFHDVTEKRRAQEALQRSHDELETKVAERTAELREKDQLLLQQSRQAAMGEMIGNIAHQWRQPLNTLALIFGTLPVLQETGELSREMLVSLEQKAMELIQHMSQTINDFRNYFKPDKERVAFPAWDAVTRAVALIEDSFRSQEIAIEVTRKENPLINGYPNEFSQVLLNILLNARDAFLSRTIRKRKVDILVTRENGRAVVTVTDNAGGIPVDILDKIFDPYFTTKGPEQGSGVGLFMSKGIIEKNMGGRLSARNTGDGAEFRVEV